MFHSFTDRFRCDFHFILTPWDSWVLKIVESPASLYLLLFLVASCGMPDLSPLTTDQTCILAVEARSPNHNFKSEHPLFVKHAPVKVSGLAVLLW